MTPRPLFLDKEGLRQGDPLSPILFNDPLSPILFNLVADMLAILIARAKGDDQLDDLIPHLVDGGVSIFNMQTTQ
jgi:hypothetical protein